MTEKLFLQDSHMRSCAAAVLTCEPAAGGTWLLLDRTVFFPAKGGQPCDTGTIDTMPVTAVEERGEEIWHFVNAPYEKNDAETVEACIGWARRFDIMQQHTGEHLLSYCAWKLAGAFNVGFHCALGYATLDLDIPLTAEQLIEMEDMANAIAAENREVSAALYENEEDLADLPMRKHAEGLEAPIRIVTIADADCCTCCAPHVKATGEIGQMKITEVMAYKGGMRLTFLCGTRALKHAQFLQAETNALARSFSTGLTDVRAAVAAQGDALSKCRRELSTAYAALDAHKVEELKAQATQTKSCRLLVAHVPGLEGKRLRALAQKTLSGKSMSLLFSDCGGKLSYILCLEGIKADAGELLEAVNGAVRGKGGGRGTMAQGSATTVCEELAEIVEQLRGYYSKALGGR